MAQVDLDAAGFQRHSPAGQRFAVALPADWDVHLDPYADVPLIGVAPEVDGGGFRTNVVVTVERVDEVMTLDAWQAGAEDVLPQTLTDYQLLDLQAIELDGRPAIRRLAHHDSGGHAVTMEQWTVLDTGCGFTFTASTATLAYPAVAGSLGLLAGTFRVAS